MEELNGYGNNNKELNEGDCANCGKSRWECICGDYEAFTNSPEVN